LFDVCDRNVRKCRNSYTIIFFVVCLLLFLVASRSLALVVNVRLARYSSKMLSPLRFVCVGCMVDAVKKKPNSCEKEGVCFPMLLFARLTCVCTSDVDAGVFVSLFTYCFRRKGRKRWQKLLLKKILSRFVNRFCVLTTYIFLFFFFAVNFG
jgi:hypothetical protein